MTEPSLPETMRAVRIAAHGGLEALEHVTIPTPTPGPGEVLVRVRAAGINHLDIWVRRGVPGHEFPLPLIPGSDGAGEIVAVGPGIDGERTGERVLLAPGVSCGVCEECLTGRDHRCRQYGILGETCDGSYAEFVAVSAANVIPIPAGIDFPTAAAFPLAALTAWGMLVDRARIRPGEDVLIIAGASGVGTLGIQIAKLHGCRVIATAGGEAKRERLKKLGADEVIDHGKEKIARRVKEITSGRGVDVVFEHVGEATWEQSLRSLAWGGRLVTCGATTGAEVGLDLRPLFFKNISILGSTMGSKGWLHRLVRFLGEGRLAPVVGERRPLEEAREAHRALEERRVFGKVVLEV